MRPQRFVLLGHPVRHSVSHAMHAAAFRAHDLPHTYTPLDVPYLSDLGRILNEVRSGVLAGANITLPYKRDVLKLVDEVHDTALATGAANVVARDKLGRLVAHNTDVSAFEAELALIAKKRSRAAVIGSGGGALAAISACARLGFSVVGATSRSWHDSEATVATPSAQAVRSLGAITSPWPKVGEARGMTKFSQALRLQFPELAATADVIIQATSAGMWGGDSGDEVADLVPWSDLHAGAAAMDLIYRPLMTPFLLRAAERGLAQTNGLGMLIRQAEASYEVWIGTRPKEGVMRAAAERALGIIHD